MRYDPSVWVESGVVIWKRKNGDADRQEQWVMEGFSKCGVEKKQTEDMIVTW